MYTKGSADISQHVLAEVRGLILRFNLRAINPKDWNTALHKQEFIVMGDTFFLHRISHPSKDPRRWDKFIAR